MIARIRHWRYRPVFDRIHRHHKAVVVHGNRETNRGVIPTVYILLLLLLLLRLLLLATAPLLSSGPDRSAKLKMGSLALPLLEEGPPGPSAKLLANTVIGLH